MAKKKLLKGNEAFAVAAIQAGCRQYFGYPITPQNEVPEYMSREMAKAGGSFVQAESELASISLLYGASAAGGRCLTSSSSPGIALMQEGIGSIIMCQLPCVIINVMRGGPGIGSIQPAQADYNQVTRGGFNGDGHVFVYAPSSIQEAMDMIYNSFDVADEYRNPVIVCVDGMIGQMMEPVVIPPAKEPVKEEDIPKIKPWALTGHKDKRLRNKLNSVWLAHEELEERTLEFWPKYEKAERELADWEEYNLEGADAVFVSFGSTSRVAREAIDLLEKEGIKIGMIRPKTLWPFPKKAFESIDKNTTKMIISVELSMGQMLQDVKLASEGKYPTGLINRVGGMMLDPIEIVDRTKKLLKDLDNGIRQESAIFEPVANSCGDLDTVTGGIKE